MLFMNMALNETVEMWDSVKEELKTMVPEASHPWIMPLEPVGFENDTITFLTGASFAVQVIRKFHYQQIVEAFKRVTGRDIKFEIIVDAKKSEELKKQTEKLNTRKDIVLSYMEKFEDFAIKF